MTDAIETDVVVVGSGAGGLSAALTARLHGLDVVVLEKTGHIGGSTAVSGGAVWIPGNHHAEAMGIPDNREDVRRYLAGEVGNRTPPALIEAFLDAGPRMVRFLEERTQVRFSARRLAPDYHSDADGAAEGGRVMDPLDFDGRLLGEDFDRLRPPLREFTLFGGMMIGRADIMPLVGMFRSAANARHVAGILARHAADRLRHRRGTRLVLGNALAARLFRSALDLGVDIRENTPVEDLLVESGVVAGVVAGGADGRRLVRARRGVVLAGGGFPGAPERYGRPLPDRHVSMAPAGNTGDGIALGESAGGLVPQINTNDFFWTPVSVLRRPDGTTVRYPHLFFDRAKPGVIAVNAAGRRFVNEAASYHDFVQGMLSPHEGIANDPAWLVADAAFVARWGLGLARPAPFSNRKLRRAGYLLRGRSIEALARRIGVPEDALAEAVATYNDGAARGEDPAFGKGSTAYNRYLGDPDHGPNPCLRPLDQPPYYAVQIVTGDIGSSVGLSTDERARVVDRDGHPVLGLYAVGNDMNSIMAGAYPGAGITLGPALTFGYLAGCDVSGVSG